MKVRLAAIGSAIILITLIFFYFLPQEKATKSIDYDPWVLETKVPDNDYGTYLGNGYFSTRIKAAGTSTGAQPVCLVAGLYNQDSLLPMPNWDQISFYAVNARNGRRIGRFLFDPNAEYRQRLDMKRGILETWSVLRFKRWRLNTHTTVFVSRENENLGGISISFTSNRNGRILISHAAPVKIGPMDGKVNAAIAYRTTIMDGPWEKYEVYRSRRFEHYLNLKTKTEYRVEKLASVVVSPEGEDPLVKAYNILRSSDDFSKILTNHIKAWQEIWKNHDIIIEGDPESQQVIHSNLFYLLCSARSKGHWSIAPCGLSSEAWGGQIFWDADVWMFPALLPQFPDFAKPMLEYRNFTLEQARKNASEESCKGASFAWQSAFTGKERAPEPYRYGRHVTAGVAQAHWQYFLWTNDKKWLKDRAFPILRDTANYWATRSTWNPKHNRYEIHRVVGPDELAEIVNNSAYTNAMAAKNLNIAAEAAEAIGLPYPSLWRTIADKLWIPYDAAKDRFIEYENYNGRKTKQADTEMLIFPVEHPMSKKTAENTFDYWHKRVEKNNPAMSDSMFSIIACRLGRPEQAYDLFLKSYRPFLRGPFNYFNEKESLTYDNACFLTGCAGCIQSVLYGFGGLSATPKGLDAKPLLPKKWKKLEIKGINFRGRTYDLLVEKDKWIICPQETVSHKKSDFE